MTAIVPAARVPLTHSCPVSKARQRAVHTLPTALHIQAWKSQSWAQTAPKGVSGQRASGQVCSSTPSHRLSPGLASTAQPALLAGDGKAWKRKGCHGVKRRTLRHGCRERGKEANDIHVHQKADKTTAIIKFHYDSWGRRNKNSLLTVSVIKYKAFARLVAQTGFGPRWGLELAGALYVGFQVADQPFAVLTQRSVPQGTCKTSFPGSFSLWKQRAEMARLNQFPQTSRFMDLSGKREDIRVLIKSQGMCLILIRHGRVYIGSHSQDKKTLETQLLFFVVLWFSLVHSICKIKRIAWEKFLFLTKEGKNF